MSEQQLVEEQIVDSEQRAESELAPDIEAAPTEPVEESVTAAEAVGTVEAEDSSSPAKAEDTTAATEAEDTTAATETEDTTAAIEAEDTTAAIEAEDTTAATEAEDTTATTETEDTTAAIEAEDSADEAEAEDSTDEAEDTSDTDSIFDLQPRQQLVGTVKNITKFGAFVDLGLPQDGLVHISELARRKVDKVEDVVSVGQEVEVWVKKVDRKRGRISLTMVKPVGRRIRDIQEGEELEGTVTRLESYGAFVNVDSERDGLVHISQITHDYIKHPGDALAVGDKIQVKVLKVNRKKRQIDLSIKALLPPPASQENAAAKTPQAVEQAIGDAVESDDPMPTAMAVAFATLHQEISDANASLEDQPEFDREKQKHKQEQEEIIARMLTSNK